jgi:hypothetical protein
MELKSKRKQIQSHDIALDAFSARLALFFLKDPVL